MNHSDLYIALARKCDITVAKAKEVVDGFKDIMSDELQNRGQFQLVKFITAKVVKRKSRKQINPQTKTMMQLPEREVVVAKISKAFSKKVL